MGEREGGEGRRDALVRLNHVAALVLGDRREELLPVVREEERRARTLVEEGELLAAELRAAVDEGQRGSTAREGGEGARLGCRGHVEGVDRERWTHGKDAAQRERLDPLRVRLGVRERERASPAPAKHVPLVDLDMLAHLLKVGDERPRVVVLELGGGQRVARAALVDEDDVVQVRVEALGVLGVAAAAGTAVDEEDGLALRGRERRVSASEARGRSAARDK